MFYALAGSPTITDGTDWHKSHKQPSYSHCSDLSPSFASMLDGHMARLATPPDTRRFLKPPLGPSKATRDIHSQIRVNSPDYASSRQSSRFQHRCASPDQQDFHVSRCARSAREGSLGRERMVIRDVSKERAKRRNGSLDRISCCRTPHATSPVSHHNTCYSHSDSSDPLQEYDSFVDDNSPSYRCCDGRNNHPQRHSYHEGVRHFHHHNLPHAPHTCRFRSNSVERRTCSTEDCSFANKRSPCCLTSHRLPGSTAFELVSSPSAFGRGDPDGRRCDQEDPNYDCDQMGLEYDDMLAHRGCCCGQKSGEVGDHLDDADDLPDYIPLWNCHNDVVSVSHSPSCVHLTNSFLL